MKLRKHNGVNRLLASLLTLSFLVSSPDSIAGQAQLLRIVLQPLHRAERATTDWFIRELESAGNNLLARELPKKERSRGGFGRTEPTGRAIDTTFDKLDRIDTISDAIQTQLAGIPLSPTGPTEQKPIVDYSYIGPSRVLERSYANGVRLTYLDDNRQQDAGYDRLKRAVMHRHLDQSNGLVAGFDYSYDRMNNKLSEVEKQRQSVARSENYKYDSAYRLGTFARQGEAEDNWQFDGVGNWASRRGLLNEVNNMNEYTAFGKAVGIPLQFVSTLKNDDNGNLLDDGTNQFEFDFANRLRRVTRKADRAVVAVYEYDAHNRRVMTSVNTAGGVTGDLNECVRYFYDGWREIEARRGVTQQYVYGMWIDEPLTLDIDATNDGRIEPSDSVGDGDSDRFDQITRDKRFFYSDDGKRYIAALTDNRGAVVERYRYDAYGVPTITDAAGTQRDQSAVNNPYLFNGRRFDPESGLYYYRNRYMNPQHGRLIHRDPIGMWRERENLGNGYAYVANNPTNRFNPYGSVVGRRSRSFSPIDQPGEPGGGQPGVPDGGASLPPPPPPNGGTDGVADGGTQQRTQEIRMPIIRLEQETGPLVHNFLLPSQTLPQFPGGFRTPNQTDRRVQRFHSDGAIIQFGISGNLAVGFDGEISFPPCSPWCPCVIVKRCYPCGCSPYTCITCCEESLICSFRPPG